MLASLEKKALRHFCIAGAHREPSISFEHSRHYPHKSELCPGGLPGYWSSAKTARMEATIEMHRETIRRYSRGKLSWNTIVAGDVGSAKDIFGGHRSGRKLKSASGGERH